MSTVDILLPVRDSVATLPDALEGIRTQTLPDFRCLILDDGSRDASAEVGERYAAEDGRFEIVRGERRGLVPTLNDGLARVRAPLVARMDADDEMMPERLAEQVAFLRADPEGTVVSSLVEFFGESVSEGLRGYERWLNSLVTHRAVTRDLLVESPLPHPSVMVRTDALRAVNGYSDGPFPEDYDLWLRGWRAGWRFGKVPKVLTRIREHRRRLTWTDSRYSPRAFLECKAEHLAGTLREREHATGDGEVHAIVWGAGRDGKRMAKALRKGGVALRHFVDIAPTKVGRRTMGVPILPAETLVERPDCVVLACVGTKGARAQIRERLARWGYAEGRDFFCLA
ncbi:MAG: glycosyltransferase [Gemmatimonadota bacterium]|jgi:glycosyltransferase involved in cell wall biosynthesis|nr:glycosyltransferase [Gemmatimonadota bacterium]MDP6803009.1 glycosyltransferase [Gemmatimonadota bacterium]MDP7032272.1 glycosyltransferase [Gemmatimonadota bacterium]